MVFDDIFYSNLLNLELWENRLFLLFKKLQQSVYQSIQFLHFTQPASLFLINL
jgi:hypothetical protein